MAKPNLHSLSRMDFLKVVPNRKEKIQAAPYKPLPTVDSYKPNQLAKALHPDCQHLRIAEVLEHGKDVKSYVLVPDVEKGTNSLAYFSAGQYLSIELEIGGAHLTRPYSLCSSPKDSLNGRYMLTIKRVDDGLASQYILDNWTVGTCIKTSAPLGVFTYEPLRDAKTIIGLAGGSGITPFYSLAQAIADEDEDIRLILLYGSRRKSEILFLNEFKDIESKCPKFKLVNVLSDEEADGCEKGFITSEVIKKYAPHGEYSIFICGPQAMYSFVDKEIEKLGLRRKFIRHELFGEYHNPERNADYPKEAATNTFKLTVKICGETSTIDCNANETLLSAIERNGISISANCRSGICGWCHSRLISGEVYTPKEVDGRRLADLQYGYIHPCCSFPLSDVSIDVPPFKA